MSGGEKILAGLKDALNMARGWEPISTAPKNEGTFILVCRAGDKIAGIAGWEEEDGWFWLNGMFHAPCEPTHWQPLPEPPVSE